MSSAPHLARFRELLALSALRETGDPAPILAWLEARRSLVPFRAERIGLDEVRRWFREPGTGNIVHDSGAFFSIEGVRVISDAVREVNGWDQPIFSQKEGGVLALLASVDDGIVRFLLHAKPEPGNIGGLQLAPTVQCTWSNLKRAHGGRLPTFGELILDEAPVLLVYEARHNEEGGRFWRKSNSNRVILVSERELPPVDSDAFARATLSQIKALALIDDVLSPFVKTIVAPL